MLVLYAIDAAHSFPFDAGQHSNVTCCAALRQIPINMPPCLKQCVLNISFCDLQSLISLQLEHKSDVFYDTWNGLPNRLVHYFSKNAYSE